MNRKELFDMLGLEKLKILIRKNYQEENVKEQL